MDWGSPEVTNFLLLGAVAAWGMLALKIDKRLTVLENEHRRIQGGCAFSVEGERR